MTGIRRIAKILGGAAKPTSGVVIRVTPDFVTLATTQGSGDYPYSGIQPQINQTLVLRDGVAVAIRLKRKAPAVHYV